ncbi:hypothetical protein JOD67_007002 [Tenggerimyces flavus]|nr:hypothetical protein [Tenggerimyces flavus]
MQYLVSVIDDETRSVPAEQDAAERAATSAFNDRLKVGHWVSPPASVRRTRPPSSTTGLAPRYSPTGRSWSRRSISAVWIFEAADLDVALELAADGSKGLQPKGRGAAILDKPV